MAESLLDRLINTSHQVFMNRPSYRPNKVAARKAADRPPKLTAIRLIRLTLPFLSRWSTEYLYETLRACKQMTNTNAQISTGVEFSPATVLTNEQELPSDP